MMEADGEMSGTASAAKGGAVSRLSSAMFRIFLTIDFLAIAILVYFFLIGIADGSVSAFNIETWVVVLAGSVAVAAGGVGLQRSGRLILGALVLAVLAIPAFLYGLFVVVLVFSGVSWH